MSPPTNATSDPNRIDPDALVRAVVDGVVTRALATRPRLAARHWYASLLLNLGMRAGQTPSRHKFERMVFDERRRRRSVLEAATADAAGGVAAELRKVGKSAPPKRSHDRGRVPAGGESTRPFPSAGPFNAFLDDRHTPRGQRSGELSKEAFRTFIFDPAINAHVPEEIMPTWWKRHAAKLRISHAESAAMGQAGIGTGLRRIVSARFATPNWREAWREETWRRLELERRRRRCRPGITF